MMQRIKHGWHVLCSSSSSIMNWLVRCAYAMSINGGAYKCECVCAATMERLRLYVCVCVFVVGLCAVSESECQSSGFSMNAPK